MNVKPNAEPTTLEGWKALALQERAMREDAERALIRSMTAIDAMVGLSREAQAETIATRH